jgi:hypothetical protein
MKISSDITHLQTSDMSIIDSQSLIQLRDEIRSLRRDFLVICQQQTHTHHLIQQQQAQFHQLISLLVQKNSSLNSHNVHASVAMPSLPLTSYNPSNQFQSTLATPTPQNTSFSVGDPNIPFVPETAPCLPIQRPEPAYPVIKPTTDQDLPRLEILPMQVGHITNTNISTRKRPRVNAKKDETKEKDAVENDQNSNPTTLRLLQMGNKSR